MIRTGRAALLAALPALAVAHGAPPSGGGSVDLAKKLSNPVADLISVPLQFNYDEGLGLSNDGSWTTTKFQPVVPISLNADWNLIWRTIVTDLDQDEVTGDGESQSGFGDTLQSFCLSPKAPTESGWICGVGPAVCIPSYGDTFSGDQWALGVTGVALRQQQGWTYGVRASQLWGIEPPWDTDAISSAFVQPFLCYTTPDA